LTTVSKQSSPRNKAKAKKPAKTGLAALSITQKRELLRLLEEKERRRRRNNIITFFPDEGPLRRDLYTKHIEFFAAGAGYRERLFLAANRVGKSVAGSYEMALHLTGRYPEWWQGRRFEHPVSAWAAGDTNETVRDIIQLELLGDISEPGTGMIPGDDIVDTTRRPGVPDAIQTILVKHVTGGTSRLGLKSYDQKRKAFQGTAKHIIWLDEEPPQDVYAECLLRTMTTDGIILLTFTPLLGISDVVKSFLHDGKVPQDEVHH
jgi:phage terminase large subunit-like protein